MSPTPLKLAIACQGGGSHCAFSAGVLVELLAHLDDDGLLPHGDLRYRIVALSGTSGGAINALLTWYGLIHPEGPQSGQQALLQFWREMSASSIGDMLGNFFTVQALRLRELVPQLEIAPNIVSHWAQQRIRDLIETQVPFNKLHSLLGPQTPRLLIGAANVLSGRAEVFIAGPQRTPRVEEILASTAVPNLFSTVEVDGKYYWDGLLSQNPPIRNFLSGCAKEAKPDSILLIRINPEAHAGVPKRLADIQDRQNEMAGNLALDQERFFIGQINRWLEQGTLQAADFKPVNWQEISLETRSRDGDALDYASKLDRDPGFIEGLIASGREHARAFLAAESVKA